MKSNKNSASQRYLSKEGSRKNIFRQTAKPEIFQPKNSSKKKVQSTKKNFCAKKPNKPIIIQNINSMTVESEKPSPIYIKSSIKLKLNLKIDTKSMNFKNFAKNMNLSKSTTNIDSENISAKVQTFPTKESLLFELKQEDIQRPYENTKDSPVIRKEVSIFNRNNYWRKKKLEQYKIAKKKEPYETYTPNVVSNKIKYKDNRNKSLENGRNSSNKLTLNTSNQSQCTNYEFLKDFTQVSSLTSIFVDEKLTNPFCASQKKDVLKHKPKLLIKYSSLSP